MTVKEKDKENFQESGWLRLDNAAKLFPAIVSEDLTSVFRITATLKQPVRYSAIVEAVAITSKRFPYFNVSLGNGIFWHFLELHDHLPRIQTETETPCTSFNIKNKNEPLYRILVKGKNISVEFSHIITDGGGASEYLKTLLYTYFLLTGEVLSSTDEIILPESPVMPEEYEDAYKKFFKKLPSPVKLAKAWHLPFSLSQKPKVKVINAEMPVDEMKVLVKKYNVSMTEYFVAVYLFALQEIFEKENNYGRRKVLRIEVPVNMRNKLPSRTMRNFSLFVLPEIDLRLGNYDFDEILKSVHHQLQISSDVKQILRFLSSNVGYEKLYIVRLLPLFLKEIVIASVYRNLASKRWSGIFTNLGAVKLSHEMEELIDSFQIIPPPPNRQVKVTCALISYKNRMRVSFINITQSNELEKNIIKHFSEAGIHVKLVN
ncbi:MAG: hypothetical protein ACM3NR_01555 [Methanosarcina sp.]